MKEISIDGNTYPLYDETDGAFTGNLPDLDCDNWDDLATLSYSNDLESVKEYDLGQGFKLYVDRDQTTIINATITTDPIERHLSSWSYDDYPTLADFLAAWGLDGLSIETEADETWEGPCRVWREPQFYQGTYGAPKSGFATDEDGDPIDFPSYKAAAQYVHNYYNEPSEYDGVSACNVLSHGQAGSDILTIVTA